MRLLLPLLPVPVATAVLAVWRPGLLRAGVASPRAVAVSAALGLTGLLVLLVLRRRSLVAALWSASAVVLVLMAVVVAPAFRERTVQEDFPPVALDAAPAVASPAPRRTAGPSATATPATARRVSTGSFRGIDHEASGVASLYDVAGALRLRFEQISFQGTPSPSVHLVPRGARTPKGGVRLGALKGEHGSFSYPTTVDAAGPWTVLVWCDRYATPIAAADLA